MKNLVAFELVDGDGSMGYIDPGLVEAISPANEDSRVMLASGQFLFVKGDPATVARILMARFDEESSAGG